MKIILCTCENAHIRYMRSDEVGRHSRLANFRTFARASSTSTRSWAGQERKRERGLRAATGTSKGMIIGTWLAMYGQIVCSKTSTSGVWCVVGCVFPAVRAGEEREWYPCLPLAWARQGQQKAGHGKKIAHSRMRLSYKFFFPQHFPNLGMKLSYSYGVGSRNRTSTGRFPCFKVATVCA